MTSNDVRKIGAYGKRIARCVLRMSDIVTLAAKMLPNRECALLMVEVAAINKEMDDASRAWAETVPTEMWDA